MGTKVQHSIEPITRKSLHYELVDRIQSLVLDGTLPAGQKIPEKELCVRFGVSRTPMREALKVLAVDGLVYLEPNRGAWVSKLTVAELEEVFPIMAALEALSGELACENLTEDEYERICQYHQEMLVHYESGNLAEYFRTNQLIHEAILEAARNNTLAVQYRSLAARVRRARYLANMSQTRWRQAVKEHEEIIAALCRRDGKGLSKILKRHMANKFETVRQWLNSDAGSQVAEGRPLINGVKGEKNLFVKNQPD